MEKEFTYDYETNCNPIPPGEKDLPTQTAEYFVKVTDVIPTHLEGVCFDRTGDNMYFCSTDIGRVFKLDMKTKELKIIWEDEGLRSFGIKMHKDGRIFACCFGTKRKPGVYVLSPEGEELEVLLEGQEIDDLIFDRDGGFYASKFIGNVYDPAGGVYYVSPDFKTVTPYAENLAAPNGVALSKDEKILWITEYCGGRLLRTPVGGGWGSVPYHFTGFHGPDSCEIDDDDNLYVACTFQGRIMVFNRDGFPIGQILTPKREEGRNLISTHATLRPGTDEVYISCSDDTTDEGSWIFKAKGFAKAYEGAFQFL